MTPEEYADFQRDEPPGYGAEMVASGAWKAEEAPRRAREEFGRLLPQGLATPKQFLRSIFRRPDGARVGILWWGLQPFAGGEECFIWDIAILEPFRRQGLAEATLAALEVEARAAGALHIALHVFGSNRPAITLYEKLGYRTTNLRMRKPLG